MRKMFSVLAAMTMVAGVLTGCGGNTASEVTSSPAASTAVAETAANQTNEEVKKIGIVQVVEHPSLTTIREHIISELAAEGYVDGETVTIDYQNAQNDQSNLNSICQKFVADDVDLIIAIATPSAQAAAAATTDIPIVFASVVDPIGAKIVDNLEAPSGNVTGTSNAIPMDKTYELCKQLTPEVKSIGFLYTASESNAQSIIANAKETIGDYGFTYEEMTIASTSELQQAAQVLAGKVDAIYVPIDNTIASAMPVLAEVGKETQTPIYAAADSLVADGAYATVGISYEELGDESGKIAGEVLGGKAISEIPVKRFDNFQTIINKTTAEAIGAPAEAEGASIME